MEKKIFYRVGTKDGGGMWYHPDGTYHGSINTEPFSMLQCHSVTMPFDENIVGYLSVVDSLENLKKWFNDKDMEKLTPIGYQVLSYEATDYRIHDNHWIINQKTSTLLTIQP